MEQDTKIQGISCLRSCALGHLMVSVPNEL